MSPACSDIYCEVMCCFRKMWSWTLWDFSLTLTLSTVALHAMQEYASRGALSFTATDFLCQIMNSSDLNSLIDVRNWVIRAKCQNFLKFQIAGLK